MQGIEANGVFKPTTSFRCSCNHVMELAERVVELSRHYAIWWLLVDHETHEEFKGVIDDHRDFIEATAVAHFQSLLLITYQLLDGRSDVISIKTLLGSIRTTHPDLVRTAEQRIFPHQQVYDDMASVRSKVCAHRDLNLGPEMVFAAANLSPNTIGACVDVLRDVMNEIFRTLLPDREQFEFYEEATNRADFARNDGRRILAALSNKTMQPTCEDARG